MAKNVADGKVKRTFDLKTDIIKRFDSYCKDAGLKSNFVVEHFMKDFILNKPYGWYREKQDGRII